MLDDDLRTAVRRKCGKVTATSLGDDDIDAEGVEILKIIAERLTERVIREITSVANQREYSVNAATIRVQKVFRWDGIDPDLLQLGSPEVPAVDRNVYYNFPSLWTIEQMLKRRGLPPLKFEFNPVERKLKIDPMPREADLTYYYISVEKTDWTMAKVPDDFEGLLITGTSWKCLEILALERTTLGGIPREGGRVDYPADRLRKYVDAYRNEFYDALKIKAMLYNK